MTLTVRLPGCPERDCALTGPGPSAAGPRPVPPGPGPEAGPARGRHCVLALAAPMQAAAVSLEHSVGHAGDSPNLPSAVG